MTICFLELTATYWAGNKVFLFIHFDTILFAKDLAFRPFTRLSLLFKEQLETMPAGGFLSNGELWVGIFSPLLDNIYQSLLARFGNQLSFTLALIKPDRLLFFFVIFVITSPSIESLQERIVTFVFIKFTFFEEFRCFFRFWGSFYFLLRMFEG